MQKVKLERGQKIENISVSFLGVNRELIYPGKAQMLDIQGAISQDQSIGMIARICAGAIGLCLDQTSGFIIKTDPKKYKFKFMDFADELFEELSERDIEVDEIIKVGTEIISKISQLFSKEVKKAENFSEAP